MIHEVIIIGSGPTGIAAALSFVENGITPLILDVGYQPGNDNPVNCNFYDYRKSHDSFDLMIGKNYDGLSNVISKKTLPPKLTSPYMQFVIKDAEKMSPVNEKGFHIIQSFAMGGLANAWGAGLYRCIDDELINLPVQASELSPYYDKLTKEIGISGDNDDLTSNFGSTESLLPPLTLSYKSKKLFSKYQKNKKKLHARGIYMGRPRLGVLSQNYHERTSHKYQNLELWLPDLPSIYNPSFTLQRLIKENKVHYHKSVLVKCWSRAGNHLVVHAENINNSSGFSFTCKRLVLAAGTINSAKIVLNSKKDFKTRLPLIDNPLIQVPLIFPTFIGSKLETDAFGLTNLNIIFDFKKHNLRLHGSIVELTSPARAVFYEKFPLSSKDNLLLMKLISSSFLVLLLYFPSSKENSGCITLKPDGKLEAYSPPYKVNKSIIKKIIRSFISMGILTNHRLIRYSSPGYAVHYAGTMPMVKNPAQDYQCNKWGEVHKERGVYVVDGSLFSYLPAKNISFTLMANSMRIADNISKKIKRQ
jgi:choline dehydrogenase-like flavoprotein